MPFRLFLLALMTSACGSVESTRPAPAQEFVIEVEGERFRVRSSDHGTVNFLGLAAVPAALEFITDIGLTRLSHHVTSLARDLHDRLRALRHRNGAPLVALYGASGDDRGGTIAFNVLDAAGIVVPYWRVEERAREMRVSIRGGCFCNPGAAERALDIDRRALADCLRAARDRGVAFSHAWLADRLGRPVGALRISVGYGTDGGDIARGVRAIEAWKA